MRVQTHKLLASVLFVFLQFFVFTAQSQEKCSKLFYSTLADQRQFRVMSYNFFNLEKYKGKHILEEPFKYKQMDGAQFEARARENEFREQQAQIIKEINPDFIISEEVDDLPSMKNFSRVLLENEFDSLLISGNDPRGIDIGLFVRTGLDVAIEHITHKNLTWFDPSTGRSIKLFTRDLPVWIIKDKSTNEVLLILAGMHSKSKRDRYGDHESQLWRSAQIKKATQILKVLAEKYPVVPLIWGGDFNTDIQAKEMKPAHAVFEDAFDVAEITVPKAKRITHSYFPYNGRAQFQQLDGFFALNARVLNAQIFLYRDENGNIKPVPSNIDERNKNPSDHFPIYIDIANTKK